MQLIQL